MCLARAFLSRSITHGISNIQTADRFSQEFLEAVVKEIPRSGAKAAAMANPNDDGGLGTDLR